jgi:uncharacterized protein YjiS (DUF1127 family)
MKPLLYAFRIDSRPALATRQQGAGDSRTGRSAPAMWFSRLLNEWRWRMRDRDELARLDARQLRDIGMSEEQLMRTLAKPLWRA